VTVLPAPTLEDLRDASTPAWLWDAARGRVVWANRAGVKAFDATSLFDLIDRSFDPRETGVMRIAELAQSLERGQTAKALLHFPSVGALVPFDCMCHIHALADGRIGVLAVEVPARPVLAAAPGEIATQAFSALPVPLLVLSSTGEFQFGNAAAAQLLGHDAPATLAEFLKDPARAHTLMARLATTGIVNASEHVVLEAGHRDLKLVFTRISAAAEPLSATLLLEDVTERRALERDILSRQIAAIDDKIETKALPVEASPPVETAFETLSKSIAATLEAHAASTPFDVPPPSVLVEPSAPAAVPVADAAVKIPFVPDAIRLSLERTALAIFVARDNVPLFATAEAAKLLGQPDVAALFSQSGVWQQLHDATTGATVSLRSATGQTQAYECTRARVPWQNGPADQFILRSAEKSIAAAQPTPVASEIVTLPVPAAKPASVADEPRDSAAAELKAILDVASDGIITLDDDGKIISFSGGAEAIFGVNETEVQNLPLANLLKAESRKVLNDYLSGISGPGLATVFNDGREVLASTLHGEAIPLFITVSRLQSQRSRAKLCAVVRDITTWKRTESELRSAKDQAENANRQKSDFLARISHELRTPLNAIMGFSEVMRLEQFGEIKNEKYRAYANDIHSSGGHLLSLINDLLDLSKVESGKLELNFTAESVVDATDHAIRLLQEDAKTARVILRTSFPAKLPRIVADHRSLRQVMLNLISNSIKYTNPGGQVFVSATVESNGSLVVRVKDSGIGMTAVQLQDALQPFTRVETPDRARQGTGLGLPLTKALVEANRATFQMSSTPNEGTLAEIAFPGTRVLAE
jgi:PAS domain S-box-containing protein